MDGDERTQLLWGTLVSALVVTAFIIWTMLDNQSLRFWLREDGPLAYMTAIFFGFAFVGFLIVAKRSQFLRKKDDGLRYFMTISWAVLMFVFMGEEISWGQRIIGLETPSGLAAINAQNEITIHNIRQVDSFLGGTHRWLSIMMLMTGLLIPIFAMTRIGKRTIQWWGFPVCPSSYWLFFVGAYLYGRYFREYTFATNDAAELREFLLSVGMLCFALHGAIRPCVLYRTCDQNRIGRRDVSNDNFTEKH